MAGRRRGGWVCVVLSVACGSEVAGDSGGPDVLEEERDLCHRALDLDAYDSPPLRLVAAETPECPMLGDLLVLEVSAGVPLTGVVRVDGVPTPSRVKLRGRAGEGELELYTEFDGTFATVIIPGRYDVVVGRVSGPLNYPDQVVMLDVEVAGPGELVIDAPKPLRLKGSLTLNGAPTDDNYAYVTIRERGAPVVAERLGRLRDGAFDVAVGAGTYEILYQWCDPAKMGGEDSTPFCYGDEAPEGNAPSVAPRQGDITLREVTVAADTTLDLDVETARLTGRVQIDGAPPEGFWRSLTLDQGDWRKTSIFIEPDGGFASWLIRGQYSARVGGYSGPVASELMLDGDRVLDLDLHSVPVQGEHPALPWTVERQTFGPEPQLELLAQGADYSHVGPQAPPDSFEMRMLPGVYEAVYNQRLCWPDNPALSQSLILIVAPALDVATPVTVDLELPLVRVALDITGKGTLQFMAVGDTPMRYGPKWRFDDFDGRIAGHGTLVPGRYDVWFDGSWMTTIEVTDGVTITGALDRVEVRPKLRIGGEGRDPGRQLTFTPRRVQWPAHGNHPISFDDAEGPFSLAAGQYHVTYVGGAEGAPRNQVHLGCVTVPES